MNVVDDHGIDSLQHALMDQLDTYKKELNSLREQLLTRPQAPPMDGVVPQPPSSYFYKPEGPEATMRRQQRGRELALMEDPSKVVV